MAPCGDSLSSRLRGSQSRGEDRPIPNSRVGRTGMWSPREVDPGVQPEGLEGFLEEETLELNSDSHYNHSRYKSHPCENLLLVRGHLEQGNRM